MKRRDGHGGHTPQCADCGAWLQTWGPERWRCPWTTAGDTPPPDGHFLCGRPYTRRTTADAARAFGIASIPSA